MIQTDHVDFIIRIFKVIIIIIILIKPGSFDFFNTYLFSGLMSISNTLIAAAVGAPPDNPFAFLEQSVAVLVLDPITYFKIMSLMFQGLLGIAAFILVVYGAITFVKAIFNAMKVYVMAFVGLAICFALAPIFIPFVLFKRTSELFENWIKAMLRFTIEPVLLFIGLIMLNMMLIAILQQLFNFSACFKCTLPVTFSLPGFSEMPSITLFCIPWFSPWGVDNVGTGLPFVMFFSIPLAITFCILTKIMEIYSKSFASQISSAIFGGGTSVLSNKPNAGIGMNPFSGITSEYEKFKKATAARKEQRQGVTNQVAKEAADRMNKPENAPPQQPASLASVSTSATADITGVSSSSAPKAAKKGTASKSRSGPTKPPKLSGALKKT